MNDYIKTALAAAIVGIGGIIANSIRQVAAARTDSEILLEIADAAADAVDAKFQTYVDELKKAGSFDEAAQKRAASEAVAACLASLSSRAVRYIDKVSAGDIEGYIRNKIEAEVRRRKLAA